MHDCESSEDEWGMEITDLELLQKLGTTKERIEGNQ